MSSRQPRGPTAQSSPPHRHFTTPSTYSQVFTNHNALTTLRQPSPSAQIFTSPLSVGGGTTGVTLPSSHSMVVRDSQDFSLALSIQAAQADRRECPWYGVWSKVLERYIFRNADASQTACTCVPQYSLVASHDSGRSPQSGSSGWSDIVMGSPSPDRHSMTPGSPLPGPPSVPYNHIPGFSPDSQAIFGGPLPPLTPSPLHSGSLRHVPYPESPIAQRVTRLQARHAKDAFNVPVRTRPLPQSSSPYQIPLGGIPPTTPPRQTTGLSDASFKIPDFVQILEHAQQPFPVVPGHVIRRVIMIVEIKAPRPDDRFQWESIWEEQVQEQVLHAFEADRTLKYLGVIIAAGRRWVYSTVDRGELVSRTMSEIRDPTFRNTTPPVPSSDASVVDEKEVHRFLPSLNIPDFLPKAEDGTLYQFDLLDARGDSLRAFQEIVKDLRRKNSDIWI
ncbi:uncharacterized protein F5147DRAFT_757501 [Suillus discolor]|uniref:Uncharacterized protein n=1 Tax=Suillus discolor TaxID=1912936 RepID=A0A9P7K0Q9_9AGAM|nr:uncharacterized protein F5147DRAFT_757501 [Suillus discolor]KAG2119169.1 hypothetical protein F5147DRAFT_757501 [Suillus discolor]